MAAPHVTGLVSILLSQREHTQGWNTNNVETFLQEVSDTLPQDKAIGGVISSEKFFKNLYEEKSPQPPLLKGEENENESNGEEEQIIQENGEDTTENEKNQGTEASVNPNIIFGENFRRNNTATTDEDTFIPSTQSAPHVEISLGETEENIEINEINETSLEKIDIQETQETQKKYFEKQNLRVFDENGYIIPDPIEINSTESLQRVSPSKNTPNIEDIGENIFHADEENEDSSLHEPEIQEIFIDGAEKGVEINNTGEKQYLEISESIEEGDFFEYIDENNKKVILDFNSLDVLTLRKSNTIDTGENLNLSFSGGGDDTFLLDGEKYLSNEFTLGEITSNTGSDLIIANTAPQVIYVTTYPDKTINQPLSGGYSYSFSNNNILIQSLSYGINFRGISPGVSEVIIMYQEQHKYTFVVTVKELPEPEDIYVNVIEGQELTLPLELTKYHYRAVPIPGRTGRMSVRPRYDDVNISGYERGQGSYKIYNALGIHYYNIHVNVTPKPPEVRKVEVNEDKLLYLGYFGGYLYPYSISVSDITGIKGYQYGGSIFVQGLKGGTYQLNFHNNKGHLFMIHEVTVIPKPIPKVYDINMHIGETTQITIPGKISDYMYTISSKDPFRTPSGRQNFEIFGDNTFYL
ncbi:hypothetical protein MK079_05445, partial [Candidatus Gracilibacteria bacterium]|nr:hypothetical protein [Candidatus Gracilibacteria bacterium]